MVKVPVDEAPAGPEMDAAVAEVLGWLPYECDAIWYWKDMSDDDFPYYNYVAYSHNVHSYELEDVKVWSPSTDIAAAWELGNEDGWCWKFTEYECPDILQVDLATPDILQVDLVTPERIVRVDVKSFFNSGTAGCYALGRCRAFLRASGVTEIKVDE